MNLRFIFSSSGAAGPGRDWQHALICLLLMLMVVIMSELTSAIAQTPPDVSSWRIHQVPEHGLSLKVPGEWLRNDISEGSRDIISLTVPDLPAEQPAGCGILATEVESETALDIDDYISAMSKERFLGAISHELSEPYLHKMEAVALSGRRSLMTIVSGNRKSGRWTQINFDMVEGKTFYRLQCYFRPQSINEHILTFLTVAKNLTINPR